MSEPPTTPPADDPPVTSGSSASRAWAAVVAVGGAVAGLAALVYFVGAATTWVTLRAAQLPADVAIAHGDRTQLIATGLRAILVVALITAALATLLYFVALVALYVLRRRRGDASISDTATGIALLRPWSTKVRIGVTVAASAALVVALSFTSWRWLGVGLAGLIALVAIRRHVVAKNTPSPRVDTEKSRSPWPSLATIVALGVATGIAAIALQLDNAFAVPAVIVDPPPYADYPNVAIPYFGESGDLVYLGELTEISWSKEDGYSWRYVHGVKELRRDEVLLTHLTQRVCLRPQLKPPARAILDVLRGQGSFFERDPNAPPARNRRSC